MKSILFLTTLAVSAALLLTGCTAKYYRESADKQVYEILLAKRKRAVNDTTPFTVDQGIQDPLAELPHRFQPIIPPVEGQSEPAAAQAPTAEPPAIISLQKAVEIGIRNSRDYQRRKEDLYLSALDLTLQRHLWTPQFSALLSGKRQHIDGVDSWASDNSFGVTQIFATGATLSLALTNDLVSYFVGSPKTTASSLLTATLIQPLWRGAGRRVAEENLIQAERNVIYAVRAFDRYHRTFAVDVASNFYQALEQRDVVRNEWDNYRRLVDARRRAEMLAQAGRLREFEVDQARQDELSARDRWVRAEQQYRQLLDQFKISLGLSTDANVDLDANDLAQLARTGLIHPEISVDKAVEQALALRVDLMTAEDQVADARRKVYVAENGLGPDVDLVMSGSAGTATGRPAEFRFEHGSYSAGLNVDLPLNRTAERNTYRAALIAQARAARDAAQLADTVKLQVRQAWRRLQQARDSYEIQRISLALAQRRVESTTLLLQAGRASTRDMLDAQAALLSAQNALAQVLVDHTIARLQLWRDVGTLLISPEGELKEEARDGTAP